MMMKIELAFPMITGLLLFAGGVFGQGAAGEMLRRVGFDQKLDGEVDLGLRFRGEDGGEVTLAECAAGKPVVLALVYYGCPSLCTQVLNGLVRSLKAVSFDAGEEFVVIAVSIAPGEGPELAAAKKAEYLRRYGRGGPEGGEGASARGWRFLTGEPAAIERLADSVGFRYAYDSSSGQYAHPAGVAVLTPRGRIARYFFGIEYPARDLRLGLVEASAGRIGTAVDQVLLLCFHYDPTTGRYGLAILSLIRAAGAATVLALAGYIIVMIRRERRQRAGQKNNGLLGGRLGVLGVLAVNLFFS